MAHLLHVVVSLILAYSCYCNASAAVYGEECGSNPMQQVLMVARRSRHTLTHVLEVLRRIDLPAFRTLAHKFRMYAACVGLVDTGYFKKRSSPMTSLDDESSREFPSSQSRSSSPSSPSEDQDTLPQEFTSWLKNYASAASDNSAYDSSKEYDGSVDRLSEYLWGGLAQDEYPKRTTQAAEEDQNEELLTDISELRPFFAWN